MDWERQGINQHHEPLRDLDRTYSCKTNPYPDFMVYSPKGRLLLIETKGDRLNNPVTRAKLRMGRQWQNSTGDEFRRYMVFQNNDPGLEGAYEFGKFLELAATL